MLPTKGVHHLVLTVKDVAKSKEFYSKVCGMKVIADKEEYAGLSDGTFTLWVGEPRDYLPREQAFDRNRTGLDHWAFRVATMEELKQIESKLREFGIVMEDDGITDDDFGGTAIFTQDPDGMKVEFHLDHAPWEEPADAASRGSSLHSQLKPLKPK